MMKYEFEAIANAKVSTEDYRLIEYVYQWHPLIPNNGGKEKIAEIWKVGGMELIRDMIPTAKKAEESENKITALRTKIYELERELNDEREAFDQWYTSRG